MTQPQTSAADVLRRALELLGPNGEHWYQGSFDDEQHTKCCSVGAINLAHCGDAWSAYWAGSKEGRFLKRASGARDIPTWNDSPSRTFPEVKAAFLKAIELAEQGEAS